VLFNHVTGKCRIRIATFALMTAMNAMAANLETLFVQPPESTRPRCYWYWLDGHISKEGITRDLEAMQRVGIGEAYIGIIGDNQSGSPDGEVKVLSEPFWDAVEHAIREGGRTGVDIGLFNSPGWSQSGGPWVKPKQAMRYMVLTEMRLKGPQNFVGKLPAPTGEFQDIAVVAFPAPASDDDTLAKHSPRITGDTKTGLTYEVAEPFTARSLRVVPAKGMNVSGELLVSEDGRAFRSVRTFGVDRHNLSLQVGPVPLAPITVSFPATTAKFFRLQFSAECKFSEIEISAAARVESCFEKQLAKVFQDPLPPADFYQWPTLPEPQSPSLTVRPDAVRIITASFDMDGTLRWEVPEGEWIVQRAVALPTGMKNVPAAVEARGLEVDKMNRAALREHFDAYVGVLLARIPAAERKAFKHIVADSYETGPQNWTDDFITDFKARYGYDPLRFLPILGGRIVGSVDLSDRFLWDLRRMVADRVATDYVGGLRDLCREHNLRMWLENYGHWGFPSEFLKYGGSCDEISGEFWVTGELGTIELRAASSAAHLYEMPVVWAEAFTGGPAFRNTPRELKSRGDWAFCEGINQFVLHVYIHQPWEDKIPGINAWFGTEFNRHNTWFEQSKPWIDYLRRCSVMLQAGKHVADVAYFIGEDTPKMTGLRKPELPAGYDYDFINADMLENRVKVKGGRFVLPDGISYRVLVLPPQETMRPELLKKIRDLVDAGGAVLGPAPTRSPSGQNFPACDEQVRSLAAELWHGDVFGKGRVFHDLDLTEALNRLDVPADVMCPDGMLWEHCRDGDTDIYFVSNQKPMSRTETISFRVTGRAPELWWPETGRIEHPAVYDLDAGRVRVPIHFGPDTSVFVVFRESARKNRIVDVSCAGKPLFDLSVQPRALKAAEPAATPKPEDKPANLPIELTFGRGGKMQAQVWQAGNYLMKTAAGKIRTIEVATLPAPVEIIGPWQVTFDPKWGGPDQPVTFAGLEDWSKRPEAGIRYYSGKAVYQTTFTAPETTGLLMLDLGNVEALATVCVNGRNLGTLWKKPYIVDITAAVQPGANSLEVEVVNVWMNRLIGDEQPDVVRRLTSVTAQKSWSASTELLPAGLLGPVSLRVVVSR
jgi:hypothetical protein